ncbi:DUF6283 family protein [Streptomyces sp. NPDC047869]|uniref:DUF6283 family protein n=1 Tax=Streptomyces sp. NPDC047869 TaxID=3154709 RepID=UPI0034528816
MTTLPPAPRSCASGPYRTDVPSGVWSQEEYSKLRLYDGPTWTQPPGLFLCPPARPRRLPRPRLRLLGGLPRRRPPPRLARRAAAGDIDLETAEAIRDYVSPVALFASGAEAAAHGMREITRPGPDARRTIAKIRRTRADLT